MKVDERPISGIHCPGCGSGKSRVVDSRDEPAKQARRRRHQCLVCDRRYTTYEITAEEYRKLETIRVDLTKFDVVIATLRAIKVQFGSNNGHSR